MLILALGACDQDGAMQTAAAAAASAPALPADSSTGNGGDMSASGMSASIAAGLNDSVITTKVKAALMANRDVADAAINVRARDGRITLSGTVPSPAQAEAAARAARAVEGVKQVDNNLIVKK